MKTLVVRALWYAHILASKPNGLYCNLMWSGLETRVQPIATDPVLIPFQLSCSDIQIISWFGIITTGEKNNNLIFKAPWYPPPLVYRPAIYQKVTVRPPSGRWTSRSVDKGGYPPPCLTNTKDVARPGGLEVWSDHTKTRKVAVRTTQKKNAIGKKWKF